MHAKLHSKFNEVDCADPHWRDAIAHKLDATYRHAPHFRSVLRHLQNDLENSTDRLLDIDLASLRSVLSLLGIDIRIRFSSELKIRAPRKEFPAEICKQIGATDIIFGEGGGLRYHGAEPFIQRGVTVHFQDFRAPYEGFAETYSPNKSNVSIIDLLFLLGASETKKIVSDLWSVETPP